VTARADWVCHQSATAIYVPVTPRLVPCSLLTAGVARRYSALIGPTRQTCAVCSASKNQNKNSVCLALSWLLAAQHSSPTILASIRSLWPRRCRPYPTVLCLDVSDICRVCLLRLMLCAHAPTTATTTNNNHRDYLHAHHPRSPQPSRSPQPPPPAHLLQPRP
jgi:hypothetical protein